MNPVNNYANAHQNFNLQVALRDLLPSRIAYKEAVTLFKKNMRNNAIYAGVGSVPVLSSDPQTKLTRLTSDSTYERQIHAIKISCSAEKSITITTWEHSITTTPSADCPGRFQVTCTNHEKSYQFGWIQVFGEGEGKTCAWVTKELDNVRVQAALVHELYQQMKADPGYLAYRQAKDELKNAKQELIRSNGNYCVFFSNSPATEKAKEC